MIRVTVLYPNSPTATFDMAYYTSKHLPMVRQKTKTCKGIAAEKGVSGGAPGSKPTYIAIGQLLFDSVESFQSGFGPVATEILADIPNYTNTQPVIQISEITL
ncbi:MAG TPA: EthD family reductase [Steroidobacteraceae bacterium]|nr:EthD family reductase [Steroidobacteraceae bacterium]